MGDAPLGNYLCDRVQESGSAGARVLHADLVSTRAVPPGGGNLCASLSLSGFNLSSFCCCCSD